MDLLNTAIAYKKINIAELILLQKNLLLSQALKATKFNDDAINSVEKVVKDSSRPVTCC